MNYNILALTAALVTDRLLAGLDASCLQCGAKFRLGTVAATMYCGKQRIGFFCSSCVIPEARAQMVNASNLRTSDDE